MVNLMARQQRGRGGVGAVVDSATAEVAANAVDQLRRAHKRQQLQHHQQQQHEDVLQEMDRRRDEARQPHLDDGVGEHVNQHEKERSEEEELVLVMRDAHSDNDGGGGVSEQSRNSDKVTEAPRVAAQPHQAAAAAAATSISTSRPSSSAASSPSIFLNPVRRLGAVTLDEIAALGAVLALALASYEEVAKELQWFLVVCVVMCGVELRNARSG